MALRIGPGAAHAVEAVGLVEGEQVAGGLDHAHLTHGPGHADLDRLETGSMVGGWAHPEARILVRLGRHHHSRD
ncbi:hypothetical protein Acsp02_51440 [Actinoplanes sp. NBRC 103695]|nr:hypothetical protein Acsp02_51440 [Actinoplanes sp. NBRC 103695]